MSSRRLITTLMIAAACAAATTCSQGTEPPAVETRTRTSLPPVTFQTVIAPDLPVLPFAIRASSRPAEVVRAAYEFAARHPEVLKFMPCFCGCERGGHKGNHDCFVAGRDGSGKVTSWDAHGVDCEVCLDVAVESMRMRNAGASIVQIRDEIEKRYAGRAHGHTPTPRPGKGTE